MKENPSQPPCPNTPAAGAKTDIRDEIVTTIFRRAEAIARRVVTQKKKPVPSLDDRLDNILTSPWTGFPIMLLLLGVVFWLTLTGANYPSQLLAALLFWGEEQLDRLFFWMGAPAWLHGVLISGMYRGLAWVVSVMLPPMAIFFPLFTLLEDLGYLPRVAFNLDRLFKAAGAHGKQALTMCMGFGCNAAGVISCRIIDSPRERLLAILTNNFVPCNGRFPLLITLASIFMGGLAAARASTFVAAGVVVLLVLAGILVTLLVSWLLSHSILKGVPSTFTLELPPYRKPQVGKIFVRSLLDRTFFVLTRAVMVAAPAGAVTWTLANLTVGEVSCLAYLANWLDPFGRLLGMDGMLLMAFILALPANEIVLPIAIMGYLAEGALLELDSLHALQELLLQQGWTWLTALNVMLFSLFHFPCGTTLLTMARETGSLKWTLLGLLIPTGVGVALCFTITQTVQLLT
jgi:ferrous iron transport protein B